MGTLNVRFRRLFDTITDMHQRSIGMKYSVSIDVPQLDEGLRFYRDALGLTEIARPIATYVDTQVWRGADRNNGKVGGNQTGEGGC